MADGDVIKGIESAIAHGTVTRLLRYLLPFAEDMALDPMAMFEPPLEFDESTRAPIPTSEPVSDPWQAFNPMQY